jgi:hypothetical protein
MCISRFVSAAFFVSALVAVTLASAADFRVTNSVYVEGESSPQCQSTTIFHAGLVYDFLADPAEIIVFDKTHGRFVLLDLGRHVQANLSTDQVAEFIDHAKQMLNGPKSPVLLHWLAEPTFDETFDTQSSELTLRSESMTYQVQVLATGPDVAAQYRDFSDWYARFNHVLNPESRPPFPRMMLDSALERNHGIAKEVRLTSNFAKNHPPVKITSRHELVGQLDASDKKRVAEAQDDMKSFKHIPLAEYVGKPPSMKTK